ncbi:MAG TPA: double-strand break repair protein AddB [Devosiaceae bacterium]|nr:double-strand break repair protein AddB [Devosiaceae bacterium]
MRQNLFTIAADTPFLRTLADRVLDGTLLAGWPQEGPFWLTDVTILLPTRRAALALAEAFAARGQGLLPDIRTIGDEDPVAAPFLPPVDAPAPLPAASALERRLVLAQLIDRWSHQPGAAPGFASPPHAAEIFWLADSLGGLVDDLAIERRTAADLRGVAPEDLAENWQKALAFLDIALVAWPAILAERGKADPAVLRNERLLRQAETAPFTYGERPVIAAGSTGSIPATADLLAAIARLPRGTLVLPGLDTGLDAVSRAILADPAQSPHAHPQYGLAKLLARLGVPPDAVTELGAAGPRTQLMRRALALPEATSGWVAARHELSPALPEALAGLSILAAPGEDLEARAIAIAAREAIAAGQSVGIVSPDRNLARRIAAELARHGIEVDDSAGTPLFQSAAGRLVRSLLAVAAARFAPVELMALLRNRAVSLGLGRAEVTRTADLIELRLLRGERPGQGIAGLRTAIEQHRADPRVRPERRLSDGQAEAANRLIDRLGQAMAPVCTVCEAERLDAAALAAALTAAATALLEPAEHGPPVPAPAGWEEFLAWSTAMAATGEAGPGFPPTALDQVLAALMAGSDVRPTRPGRTDIAIWGQLEARLQSADLTILAGLNEDVWPAPADPGPWLNRSMRLAAGLEPPERRQGQAAHDFEMAAGRGEVILAYAARRGSSPALPSPLLQRLEAFIGEDEAKPLRARGDRWVGLARRLDLAARTVPANRPAPRPPAAKRPRRLSVTEIETLVRSPYDIYARHVLGLRALDPLGQEPGARDRGTIIHDIFGGFVAQGYDFAAPGALDRLKEMARDAFSRLEAIGERRDIWLRRFERAAELFLAFERERDPRVRRRHAEIKGEVPLPLPLGGFLLTGRADRIDEMADGTVEIIDFKTGGVPDTTAMKAFLAPQLPLEAQMVRERGFDGITPAPPSSLTYVKIGLGPDAFVLNPYALGDGFTLESATAEMWRRLQGQIEAMLLSDRFPMTSNNLPVANKRYRGEFDHLARLEEWAVAAEDEP